MLEVRPARPLFIARLGASRAQDRMHYLILLVIAIFMSMYLGLGFMRLA